MKQTTVQPKIKQRQIDILYLLYRFRYLNRVQIQVMLKQKYHSRVLTWLNNLKDRGYVICEFDKKVAASPSVYSLAPEARAILKDIPKVQPRLLGQIWREKAHSTEFREHCLFLADIYLSLITLAKNIGAELYYYTKTDLSGMEFMPTPKPDGYFAIIEKSGNIKRYFLELFDDLPPRVLRSRINSYFKYYDEDLWYEEYPDKPFPETIIVCPSKRIKSHLNYFIQSKLDEDSGLVFLLTTKEIIESQGMVKASLEKVIAKD